MRFHEVLPGELDFVAAVCLDPSIPPKWRESMKPCMKIRKDWISVMMGKGFRIVVALEKPEGVIDSLGARNAKFKSMAVRDEFPEGLLARATVNFTL